MDKEAVLKELLRKVSDTYEDFVIGVTASARNHNCVDEMIEYLQNHPNDNSSQVTDRLDELRGLVPISSEED